MIISSQMKTCAKYVLGQWHDRPQAKDNLGLSKYRILPVVTDSFSTAHE